MWETLTGVVAPISRITPDTYKNNNLPWFDLYSELPSIATAGYFFNVQSLAEVDRIITRSTSKALKLQASTDLIDPSNPPFCKLHAC